MLVNASRGTYRASREHPRDDGIRARGAGQSCLPWPARTRSRGGSLSSAILYLAIVAIWAGVLVPRWLRPAQAVARTADARHREDAAEPWTDSDSDTEPIPVVRPEHDHLARRAAGASPAARRAAVASPAARRGMILQARRRMLLMITVLTAGAVGIAVTHLAASWVIIPPATMLGGFLMLLREAAHSDAVRARRLGAQQARVSRPVRQSAAESVVAAEEVRAPVAEPTRSWTAEIIDISARIGDELYDQYADAAVRAVGD